MEDATVETATVEEATVEDATVETGKEAFAGAAWTALARDAFAKALVGVDRTGVRVAFYEEYTGAPAGLRPDGEDTLAWHCEITEDGLDVGPGRVADPTYWIEGDYDDVAAIARLHKTDPEMGRIVQDMLARGALRSFGDRTAVPAHIAEALATVHDALAARTA